MYDEGIEDLSLPEIKEFVTANFGRLGIRIVRLKKEAVETNGLLFDFLKTEKNFKAIKYAKENGSAHIILTNKLFATLDEYNKLHIRAGIYSFASFISLPGIVEGPAKPRQYYFYKNKYAQMGIWEREEPGVKDKFKDRFIDYGDNRINEVLKGYIAQALFFYLTGEPFCGRKNCRLYNAHWQEDLIYAQVEKGAFCRTHRAILNKL